MIATAVLRAVAKRYLIERARYYVNTLALLTTILVLFLIAFNGVRVFGGGGPNLGDTLAAVVVSFMIWSFAMVAFSDPPVNMAQEAMRGTLELLAMSPLGFRRVLILRAVVVLVVQLGISLVFLFLMMAATGKWLHLDFVSILPLLLITIVGVQGVGFIMGGLAVLFKQVQAVMGIFQFGLLALIAAPPEQYPLVNVLPLSWGTKLLRRVMIEGVTITQIRIHDLLILVGNSGVYLALGLTVFGLLEQRARESGTLGQY